MYTLSMSTAAARLTDPAAVRRFLAGGKARFTLVSARTGTRYTYRVRSSSRGPEGLYFVDVLTGPDNTADYTFAGTLTARGFRHSPKAGIGADAPAVRAFAWAADRLHGDALPAGLEVWHEGRCARCGRVLTVPTSIASGFGPECAGRA